MLVPAKTASKLVTRNYLITFRLPRQPSTSVTHDVWFETKACIWKAVRVLANINWFLNMVRVLGGCKVTFLALEKCDIYVIPNYWLLMNRFLWTSIPKLNLLLQVLTFVKLMTFRASVTRSFKNLLLFIRNNVYFLHQLRKRWLAVGILCFSFFGLAASLLVLNYPI